MLKKNSSSKAAVEGTSGLAPETWRPCIEIELHDDEGLLQDAEKPAALAGVARGAYHFDDVVLVITELELTCIAACWTGAHAFAPSGVR
jgi:hypothetical protein